MALTNIAIQRTPGDPIEIVIAAETGIPNANQTVMLFGHGAATGSAGSGTAQVYAVTTISNVADPVAGSLEANAAFGSGSELAKMVIAAINANFLIGASNYPALKCVRLNLTDTDFGGSVNPLAFAQAAKVEQEFAVTPYDAATGTANLTAFKAHCASLSGAQRVQNSQFGTIGVGSNYSVTDPSTLPTPDTQYLSLYWFRQTTTQTYSLGELSAAIAALLAANQIPFNPLTGSQVGGLLPQTLLSDYISIGAGLESETALNKGWNPLRTTASGIVQMVRTVTSRITATGTGTGTQVTAYYDLQDFQVLYYWRKVLFARFSQPDFQQSKASALTGGQVLGEGLRLASLMEDQGMFQDTAKIASQFVVQRNVSDRSRFDFLTPVNVIPGLYVIATQIMATTEFDSFTV